MWLPRPGRERQPRSGTTCAVSCAGLLHLGFAIWPPLRLPSRPSDADTVDRPDVTKHPAGDKDCFLSHQHRGPASVEVLSLVSAICRGTLASARNTLSARPGLITSDATPAARCARESGGRVALSSNSPPAPCPSPPPCSEWPHPAVPRGVDHFHLGPRLARPIARRHAGSGRSAEGP